MDKELERMLALGVIEKSCSSWSNPIFGVRKPNGNLRLCLDSRKLNQVTKTDAFPLPYISRILGRLRGTRYLSSIDLSDAFWQIPLASCDKEKTAFTVPGRGLFHFISLPFGLHGAAQSLCRLMDSVLGYDLEPFVFVYLDDIIIATDTFEEHVKLLKEVGLRLRRANLSISRDKSKFCMRKLNYLGYVINEHGININPDKVSAIVNYPSPTSVRDVRRFMGMITWYSRFIPTFATRASPITDLLKKTKKTFVWTDAAESAFNELKTALIDISFSESLDACKSKSEEMLNLIISNNVRSTFPNMETILRIFGSMAMSNCTGERSFSVLRRVKDYLRSAQTDERVSNLALLSIESEMLKSLDDDLIIAKFANEKARKAPL